MATQKRGPKKKGDGVFSAEFDVDNRHLQQAEFERRAQAVTTIENYNAEYLEWRRNPAPGERAPATATEAPILGSADLAFCALENGTVRVKVGAETISEAIVSISAQGIRNHVPGSNLRLDSPARLSSAPRCEVMGRW